MSKLSDLTQVLRSAKNDFDMVVERVEDPKGDRIKITMTGTFLPYKKW